jgi:hypothetical protein
MNQSATKLSPSLSHSFPGYRFAELVGPRKVGGTYWDAYREMSYTVDRIFTDLSWATGKARPFHWAMQVRWQVGEAVTAAFAWDSARDKVIAEPSPCGWDLVSA